MNPKKPTPIPQTLADVEALLAQVAAVEALLAPLAFAPRRLAGKGARP